MNPPPIAFPRPAPELKLPRSSSPASAEKWAATLTEERRRLAEDEAALRERENNLREYEARLRALQAEIEAERANASPAPATSTTAAPFSRPSSRTPFGDDNALQTGWEKLHRAREILEAEQTHLRDDRIAVREQEAAVKRREAAVAQREAALAEREAIVAAATAKAATPAPVEEESAVSRLTSAPFKIARAVLGKG